MRIIAFAALSVLSLILGQVTAKADVITFDEMEGAEGCDRTYWLGDGIFDGCGLDHLNWFHTVTFDEPVSRINSAKVRINFWDDDPDEECVQVPFVGEVCTPLPWNYEGAAITIGSASLIPTFDFDFDDLVLDIAFGYEIAEVDSGWRSFDVPGFGNLSKGGAVAVRVDGLSLLGLQDFKINGSVLTVDYTPGAYSEVPEPGALGLVALGLAAAGIARLRKKV